MNTDFYEVLQTDPLIQINEVTVGEKTDKDKRKISVCGFIDMDASSGIGGKFKFRMKEKSFSAEFISKTIPEHCTMRLSQLYELAS